MMRRNNLNVHIRPMKLISNQRVNKPVVVSANIMSKDPRGPGHSNDDDDDDDDNLTEATICTVVYLSVA
jgi:hypothetical protein